MEKIRIKMSGYWKNIFIIAFFLFLVFFIPLFFQIFKEIFFGNGNLIKNLFEIISQAIIFICISYYIYFLLNSEFIEIGENEITISTVFSAKSIIIFPKIKKTKKIFSINQISKIIFSELRNLEKNLGFEGIVLKEKIEQNKIFLSITGSYYSKTTLPYQKILFILGKDLEFMLINLSLYQEEDIKLIISKLKNTNTEIIFDENFFR